MEGKTRTRELHEDNTINGRDIGGPAALEVRNLIKIYKTGKIEVVALNGVSFTLDPGTIAVIMGPSGCGKTTLLNMIGGLDVPDAGKVLINGKDILELKGTKLDNFRRNNIGFVFQFLNLIPTLNAEENIKACLVHANLSNRKEKAWIDELFEMVGMSARRHHMPDEMSGGEQQRVAIACALANKPLVLLADEPTGELDSKNKREIMALFTKLVEEDPSKIVIIVTHDPSFQEIADSVLFIRDGKIIYKGKGIGETAGSDGNVDKRMPDDTGQEVEVLSREMVQLSREAEKLREEMDKFREVKELLKQINKVFD